MLVKPISDGYITSPYGERILSGKRQFHTGLDISSKTKDAEILSICDGVVTACGFSESFGNRIWIKATSGPYKNYYIVYGHMKSISGDIKVGSQIKAGQVLGIIGNTGMSKGIHLHIEVADNMSSVRQSKNPMELYSLYIQ